MGRGFRRSLVRAEAMPQSFPEIRLIATDVDGTLLNSQQQLNPAVEDAVRQARSLGVKVRNECNT